MYWFHGCNDQACVGSKGTNDQMCAAFRGASTSVCGFHVYINQVGVGFQGCLYVPLMDVLAKWAPPQETSVLVNIAVSGEFARVDRLDPVIIRGLRLVLVSRRSRVRLLLRLIILYKDCSDLFGVFIVRSSQNSSTGSHFCLSNAESFWWQSSVA